MGAHFESCCYVTQRSAGTIASCSNMCTGASLVPLGIMRSMSDDHTHVQEFFGARAADWDSRFPDDGPAYAAAVAELGLHEGARVLDAGCGTGRALPRCARPWAARGWSWGPI